MEGNRLKSRQGRMTNAGCAASRQHRLPTVRPSTGSAGAARRPSSEAMLSCAADRSLPVAMDWVTQPEFEPCRSRCGSIARVWGNNSANHLSMASGCLARRGRPARGLLRIVAGRGPESDAYRLDVPPGRWGRPSPRWCSRRRAPRAEHDSARPALRAAAGPRCDQGYVFQAEIGWAGFVGHGRGAGAFMQITPTLPAVDDRGRDRCMIKP